MRLTYFNIQRMNSNPDLYMLSVRAKHEDVEDQQVYILSRDDIQDLLRAIRSSQEESPDLPAAQGADR